jgi:DNA-binding transcriptional ArsR family regulator
MSARQASAGLAESAPVFSALGDETRLRLLERLGTEGPQSISHLTEGFRLTRQAVTKHLHVLARAGLVRCRRQGREQRFELELQELEQARRTLDLIARDWGAALGRLKRMLEDEPRKR